MKKNILTLIITILPYLGIAAFLMLILGDIETDGIAYFIMMLVIEALVFAASVVFLCSGIKGESDGRGMALANMIIKLVHIPVYLFHFVLSVLFLISSIWTAPIVLLLLAVDVFLLISSGIANIGANVNGYKKGLLTSNEATAFSVLGFFVIADIVVAIISYVKVNNRMKAVATL